MTNEKLILCLTEKCHNPTAKGAFWYSPNIQIGVVGRVEVWVREFESQTAHFDLHKFCQNTSSYKNNSWKIKTYISVRYKPTQIHLCSM